MFLRWRTTQGEYFDAPDRSEPEIRLSLDWLGRVNRITRFERPFRIWIPRLLDEATCRHLTVLDLGAGDGSLGRVLTAWAGDRGWRWDFTNLDLNPCLDALNPGGRNVRGSVTALPFDDGHFDVVIGNAMTHHLPSDAAVAQHFREADRVARRLVLICDMHRNPMFLGALWLMLVALRAPRDFRSDGLVSVRRGWRVGEWRRLALEAGLTDARVWLEHGTRILLASRAATTRANDSSPQTPLENVSPMDASVDVSRR
jgi:SAM-dependent methyltransferase